MNYLKELKAFRDWLLLNDLNTSAIALWHTLMTINNMAGWKERFNAPNSTVEKLTGLSKQGLVDARKKLIENGLIEYEKGKKGKAPIYKMLSLVNSFDLYSYQYDDRCNDQLSYQSDDQSLTIPKQKQELKQNETNTAATAVHFYDMYYLCFNRQPTPIQVEEINSFIDKDGLSDEVICAAFKKASENGAGYPYARSIINSWAKKGIKTMVDVLKEQEQFELNRQKNKQRRGRTTTRTELLPDWFDEPDQPKKAKIFHGDIDAKKREIEEMLKAFDG